ncbi:hypothetical protein HQ545_05640 [Candidatus Woesearchaeota archaeon]|nr:hypothetical protein [Candidatus Woesearchaeota archaeon]
MARKSISKSIKLKKRRSSKLRPLRGSFLDKTVTVSDLLKYGGIILAFILILVTVFILGMISADTTEKSLNSENTKKVLNNSIDASSQNSNSTENIEPIKQYVDEDDVNQTTVESEPYEDIGYIEYQEDIDEIVSDDNETLQEVITEEYVEECVPKNAGFDFSYSNIDIEVSDLQREIKGDNWASLSAFELTVANNENCTIINPTKMKIKLNNKGKGSVWWDDELYLPDSFHRIKPGNSVSEIITVHASFSDIDSEKDLRVALFDDYDIHMYTLQNYVTITD